jgi:hypothetical protein
MPQRQQRLLSASRPTSGYVGKSHLTTNGNTPTAVGKIRSTSTNNGEGANEKERDKTV